MTDIDPAPLEPSPDPADSDAQGDRPIVAPTVAAPTVADLIADASEMLFVEHGTVARVEDRTIVLSDAVKGDPSLVVMRVLGQVQDASPAGAAAHGSGVVAIGVWRRPELYVAAWTKGRRRVVGYRLGSEAKLTMYIRTEGRIPTRMEFGNWYGDLPDEVTEAFMEVGLLVDEPPFPIPVPPPAPASPATASGGGAGRRAGSGTGDGSRSGRTVAGPRSEPRARAPRTPPAPRPAPAPTTRLCPHCGLRKALAQFVAGSELCIDCR